jgi:dTDP-4-dehydrorhamnose 3,5-epimerase
VGRRCALEGLGRLTVQLQQTSMPGCVEVHPPVFGDDRGVFVKLFQDALFDEFGLETEFSEWACSRSTKGVVRGLHFQVPPAAQDKLVYCLSGEVLDVAVDLRRGSPSYGRFETFPLDGRDFHAVFVPKGFAHGFAVLSDVAVVSYLMSAEFSPEHDAGMRWDSLPIPWPFTDPNLSDKDRHLVPFDEFASPWTYEEPA